MNADIPTFTFDGETLVSSKILKVSDIKQCPTVIFLPSHYREDGSCRHDEVNCEEDNCTSLKYNNEIFCKLHLEGY